MEIPLSNFSAWQLVALWRRDIVKARIRLVSEDLTSTRQDAIWSGIDCREWFIKIMAEIFTPNWKQSIT